MGTKVTVVTGSYKNHTGYVITPPFDCYLLSSDGKDINKVTCYNLVMNCGEYGSCIRYDIGEDRLK